MLDFIKTFHIIMNFKNSLWVWFTHLSTVYSKCFVLLTRSRSLYRAATGLIWNKQYQHYHSAMDLFTTAQAIQQFIMIPESLITLRHEKRYPEFSIDYSCSESLQRVVIERKRSTNEHIENYSKTLKSRHILINCDCSSLYDT